MHDRPEYDAYSLDDLLDARRSIDAATHPERAAELDRRIAARRSRGEGVARPGEALPTSKPLGRRVLRTVAVLQIAGGAMGLAQFVTWNVISSGAARRRFVESLTPVTTPLLLALLAIFVAAIVGGIALWNDHRLGRRLSLVVQGLQLVSFNGAGFGYKVIVGMATYFSVQGTTFGFHLQYGSVATVALGNARGPAFLAINVVAVLLFLALSNHTARFVDIDRIAETFR